MDQRLEDLKDQIITGQIPSGLPLIVALNGFSDAGNVVTQLHKYFKQNTEAEFLFEFDTDDFLDYRSRRPVITFKNDHYENYEPLSLRLMLEHDSLGAPFLLLQGFEPDFGWNKLIEIVLQLIDDLNVSITTWVHAIPMPVPHTRPIGSTVSGSRQDIIDNRSLWQPTTKLAASVVHALEFNLYRTESQVVGFVLLVPHYLASTDYPHVLMTALECLMDATGLLFDTAEVLDRMSAFRAQVDLQISENEESVQMVSNLESRYDDYITNLRKDDLDSSDENLPTGEQLALDFEKFLADEWGNDDTASET